MKTVKKLYQYTYIILLAVLLSDACPDFNDHNCMDTKVGQSATFGFAEALNFFVVEILNYQHNSATHQCNGDCDHSVEVDFFVPTGNFAFQPLLSHAYQPLQSMQLKIDQIILDVIPMPPSVV